MRLSRTLRKLFPFLSLALATAVLLAACVRTHQAPPMPMANLKLGVAYYTQPQEPSDMLAGYVVDDVARIDEKKLSEMDSVLAEVLSKESKNSFLSK